MMEAYGVPEEKVVVIYNGVDHDRFHPQRRLTEGRRVREQFRIPLDRPVVIFVGTGFRRKGLDRLLELWASRQLQGITLLVVGNDRRLSNYRKRWNGGDVLFVGPQPHAEDYSAAADLLVLPSVQEAFGNVVLEALASGLPVVTIPEVGAAEEIDGVLGEGILINPDDLDELRLKILRLLDKDRWPDLSNAARQLAVKYSWERYLEELEQQLYEVARHN